MQWGAAAFKSFGGKWGQALQLLSGAVGLAGMVYGLHVLMVERAQLPLCSAEVLAAVGEQNFLRQQHITVEVAGAVVQPGIWQLAVGARVAEAIEKAGGFSQRADRTFAAQGLNLARFITDGEKLYIPFEGEKNEAASVASSTSTGISINTASEKELQTLPGIGEARSTKIIENRPYTNIQELLSKEVVTEVIFEDIQALVTL